MHWQKEPSTARERCAIEFPKVPPVWSPLLWGALGVPLDPQRQMFGELATNGVRELINVWSVATPLIDYARSESFHTSLFMETLKSLLMRAELPNMHA